MALYYPNILEHSNPNLPLIDDSQLMGGAVVVDSKADRNAIPFAKRKQFTIASYSDLGAGTTMRYKSTDLGDAAWATDTNWELIGGGGGIDVIPITWDELVQRQVDSNVFVWDRYMITDQNDLLIDIKFASPTTKMTWFEVIDDDGIIELIPVKAKE